jgi:hypothetical protein
MKVASGGVANMSGVKRLAPGAVLVLGVVTSTLVASTAEARSYVSFGVFFGAPVYAQPYYPEPAYYGPAPVYVAPPPSYYYPPSYYTPPAYYAPPPGYYLPHPIYGRRGTASTMTTKTT